MHRHKAKMTALSPVLEYKRTLAAFTTERTDVVLGFTRRHPGEARFLKSARRAFREVTTRDMPAVEGDRDGVGAMSRWSVSVMRGALEE